jgi:hypothetical protein
MRDLDAFVTSLVNIDRESLIAVLSSESEAAARLAKSIRQRTAAQRSKRREAIERAARIDRIVFFLQHGQPGPEMSDSDLTLCKFLEDRLRGGGRL